MAVIMYTLITHNIIRKIEILLVNSTSSLLSMAPGRSVQIQFHCVYIVAVHSRRSVMLARGYPRGPMPSPIVVTNILHT